MIKVNSNLVDELYFWHRVNASNKGVMHTGFPTSGTQFYLIFPGYR